MVQPYVDVSRGLFSRAPDRQRATVDDHDDKWLVAAKKRQKANGAPGGIRTPDTQFRRLVVEKVVTCSLLFVKVRV
jgi:hypothetical protein